MSALLSHYATLPQSQAPKARTLGIGMIGCGTVGTGTLKLLHRLEGIRIEKVAVRDLTLPRTLPEGLQADALLTTNTETDVLTNPAVDIVVEVAGGIEPAFTWLKTAIQHGKHVVTANKALIATHGQELFALAQEHGVQLLFEAAVAGGIPIIQPLKQCLAANRIHSIAGILNGTTNYMLTRMMDDGWSYEEALTKAQSLGYAEADPTNDVGGFDAAYKLAILASIAFGVAVSMDDLHIEGITTITQADMDYARKFGYAIRLIGLAQWDETHQQPSVRVHPMFVKQSHPLAGIRNEYNAVWVEGDAVGDVMFYGKGAGELPTASSVVSDVLALANDAWQGNTRLATSLAMTPSPSTPCLPMSETENRYYIRLVTKDEAGVLAKLGEAFGREGVSLESFLQTPNEADKCANLMLITHTAKESNLQATLAAIAQQSTTQSVACVLRVLG
ncbi:MAG: homoserine dehydrogenase [Vampirovibrionales bacterium]